MLHYRLCVWASSFHVMRSRAKKKTLAHGKGLWVKHRESACLVSGSGYSSRRGGSTLSSTTSVSQSLRMSACIRSNSISQRRSVSRYDDLERSPCDDLAAVGQPEGGAPRGPRRGGHEATGR